MAFPISSAAARRVPLSLPVRESTSNSMDGICIGMKLYGIMSRRPTVTMSTHASRSGGLM